MLRAAYKLILSETGCLASHRDEETLLRESPQWHMQLLWQDSNRLRYHIPENAADIGDGSIHKYLTCLQHLCQLRDIWPRKH